MVSFDFWSCRLTRLGDIRALSLDDYPTETSSGCSVILKEMGGTSLLMLKSGH